MSEETFDQFAILEIMGHSRYAGRVTEQTVGGCAFVRIDVPAVGDCPAFTKLFGQSAIFCITPVGEEEAKAAAANFRSRPVDVYYVTKREQPARIGSDGFNDDADDDDGPHYDQEDD